MTHVAPARFRALLHCAAIMASASAGFNPRSRMSRSRRMSGGRVHEDDAVEGMIEADLEQQGNVRNHEAIFTRHRRVILGVAEASHFGVDDRVQGLSGPRVVKHAAAQHGAIDVAVGRENTGAEFVDDCREPGRASGDRRPGQHIGVDDGGAEGGQLAGDGAFAAGDVTGEAEMERPEGRHAGKVAAGGKPRAETAGEHQSRNQGRKSRGQSP